MPLKTKVLVVDDHAIILAGCRALFLEEDDIEVLAAATFAEGAEIWRQHEPDVLIVDLAVEGSCGLRFARHVLSHQQQQKIIVFSMNENMLPAALDIGAKGFVSKCANPHELLDALRAVERGEIYISRDLAQKAALSRIDNLQPTKALTTRELQVLKRVADGAALDEIAEELDVAYKTVAADCVCIRQKLGARTNAEMSGIAARLKLI